MLIAFALIVGVLAVVRMERKYKPKGHPPAFVSWIGDGKLEIDYDSGEIKSLLETSPFADNLIVEPPGYLAVRFRDEGSDLENEELHELVGWLKDKGVPFSVGKDWGPAELMEELFVHGRIRGRFKRIYWTSPGDWHVSDGYPGAP